MHVALWPPVSLHVHSPLVVAQHADQRAPLRGLSWVLCVGEGPVGRCAVRGVKWGPVESPRGLSVGARRTRDDVPCGVARSSPQAPENRLQLAQFKFLATFFAIFELPDLILPLGGLITLLGLLERLLSFGAGWYSASVCSVQWCGAPVGCAALGQCSACLWQMQHIRPDAAVRLI